MSYNTVIVFVLLYLSAVPNKNVKSVYTGVCKGLYGAGISIHKTVKLHMVPLLIKKTAVSMILSINAAVSKTTSHIY